MDKLQLGTVLLEITMPSVAAQPETLPKLMLPNCKLDLSYCHRKVEMVMPLFRIVAISLWALLLFAETVWAGDPFQVTGEVRIEISSDYEFSKRENTTDGGTVADSETRKSRLVTILKFPGQFGVGDYGVTSQAMSGIVSVSGSKTHETDLPGAGEGCGGTRDTSQNTERWGDQGVAVNIADTAHLAYRVSDDGAQITFSLTANGLPAINPKITRIENYSACGFTRPTVTSQRTGSNENDLSIAIDTILTSTDQPEAASFSISGQRDLTESELKSAASPKVRESARLEGRITWSFTFSGLPVPNADIKPQSLERGSTVSLKPIQPPNEIRTANWIVEPDEDCFNAVPVPVTPAYAALFENPRTWIENGGESIQRNVNAMADDFRSVRQQSWTMLCSLTISLEYTAGGVFRLRSKPTRVAVRPRHFATAVKSLGVEAAADLKKPFETTLLQGMNIRPDCISAEGELRSPFNQLRDNCPVAFDGYYAGKPVSSVVQLAMIPWETDRPIPPIDANGSLVSKEIIADLEAGQADGPFPLHFWIAGHKLRQTNIAAINPDLMPGGRVHNLNRHQAALYRQYLACTTKHETLHGDFYKERLARRTFSGAVDPDTEIMDPAWLIEGMWDVSQEALENRIMRVLIFTSSSVMASNQEEGEGSSPGHAWVYKQMRKASAIPKCCGRTMELKTGDFSQTVDFISGFPNPANTSCE